LTGKNGSGKSFVFDAITQVLYGSHRLGNSRYSELISKNSANSSMMVEFDFAIENRSFRVKRIYHSKVRPTFHAWEFIYSASLSFRTKK
jgi:DNA repair exonuclease SbcCD ATPase subunit